MHGETLWLLPELLLFEISFKSVGIKLKKQSGARENKKLNMHYYKNIEADASLKGKSFGVIRSGVMFVAPEVFSLIEDDELRETILKQIKINDELYFGKQVSVFDGDFFMGNAIVTDYPMNGAKGFAMVKFFNKEFMENELVVAVERIKVHD